MAAPTQINHLTQANSSTASAASKATGSFSATAGRPIIASVYFRSDDAGSLATETIQCVSTHSGATVALKSQLFYGSNAKTHAVFLVSGGSGSGTLTFSFVSGRLTNQQTYMVEEVQSSDASCIVQIGGTVHTGSGNITHTLSAFADSANFTLLFVMGDGNTDAMTKEAGYTELVNVSGGNGADSYVCEYLGSGDTSLVVTHAGSSDKAIIGMEIQAATAAADYLEQSLPRGARRGLGRGLVSSMSKLNGLWRPAPKVWVPGGLALA